MNAFNWVFPTGGLPGDDMTVDICATELGDKITAASHGTIREGSEE